MEKNMIQKLKWQLNQFEERFPHRKSISYRLQCMWYDITIFFKRGIRFNGKEDKRIESVFKKDTLIRCGVDFPIEPPVEFKVQVQVKTTRWCKRKKK